MPQPEASPSTKRYSRHFYSLDALRGLAALSVIFYHWRHFFYRGTAVPVFDEARQPFYSIFQPFYTDGWRAVDLFFALSGFIFYWLYSERVAERTTGLKEFAVLRFSRLYPLHFTTLLFVAAGQIIMLVCFGTFYVYPNNDLYHFVLNLFFASAWGFERGLSFNGPTWSISVEVFLYALFFLLCFLRLNRWWWLALAAMVGSTIFARLGIPEMSRGPISFFAGGIAYHIFNGLWTRGISQAQILGMVVFTAAMWILVPINLAHNYVFELYRNSFLEKSSLILHKDLIGALILTVSQSSIEIIVFPATILTLAMCEAFRGTLGKRVSFLGDISYSVYLLHFPLQLLVMFGVLAMALPRTVFYSPFALAGFFAVLISLALSSYHFLERPAQKWLRKRLLDEPNRVEVPVEAKAGLEQAQG